MTLKIKIAVAVIALAAMFAAGRYSVNPPNIKETEVAKRDTQTDEHKDTHVTRTTTTTKQPSGVETTTTTVETDISDHKDTDTTVQDTKSVETSQQKRSKINISILAAQSWKDPGVPSYGISISKEFLGPVTVGAFALTNGTIGISLGLDF